VRLDQKSDCDEHLVREILSDLKQRRPMTRGQFDHVVRPYLLVGCSREIAEVAKQYFH
jgi:hypothetical protein